jgi:hypothetical protein
MYKVPPRYEIALSNRALNILGLGAMVHAAMNVWIFSNPEIFPSEIKSYTEKITTYYYFDPMTTYKDRVFSANGFPFFLLLCAAAFAFLFCAPLL